MPAGLSQRIQSNLVRRSSMMLPTPWSVRAFSPWVWEGEASKNSPNLLPKMRAGEIFTPPSTILMRSTPPRRSAPKTRSRLRRPTSKSTTTTFSPSCARAAPSAAVEVVFPTPPLPDVTTRTLAILTLLYRLIQRCNSHDIAFEPGLSRPIAQGGAYVFGSLVVAVDCQQLCFDLLTVNPCG